MFPIRKSATAQTYSSKSITLSFLVSIVMNNLGRMFFLINWDDGTVTTQFFKNKCTRVDRVWEDYLMHSQRTMSCCVSEKYVDYQCQQIVTAPNHFDLQIGDRIGSYIIRGRFSYLYLVVTMVGSCLLISSINFEEVKKYIKIVPAWNSSNWWFHNCDL